MRFSLCGLLAAAILQGLTLPPAHAQDVLPPVDAAPLLGSECDGSCAGNCDDTCGGACGGGACGEGLGIVEYPCPNPYLVSPPNMIGDFFGAAGTNVRIGDQFPLVGPQVGIQTDTFILPNPASSIVGRQKIAENNSPLPRDRFYVSYSHYNDVPLIENGKHIHRITPGLEAAFWEGLASVEVRVPFASTLDSTILLQGVSPTLAPNRDYVDNDREVELGNVNINLKALLYQNRTFAVSAGSGVTIPTADDIIIKEGRRPNGNGFTRGGTTLARFENDAIHVLPFIAGLYTPSDRLFVHGFAQLDFDTNGNDVFVDVDAMAAQIRQNSMQAPGFPNTGLRDIGRADDSTYFYGDVGVGYWVYRNPCGRMLKGIVPTAEVHYNRALEETHRVGANSLFQNQGAGRDFVRFQAEQIDVLNMVLGGTLMLADSTSISLAYGFPMKSSDKQWDWEARAVFNWFLR